MNEVQLELFGGVELVTERKKAVYDSYEEWIAHFNFNPKTTDECWTPPDVYDVVLTYVRSLPGMDGRPVIRPFFPGGDYRNTEYPDGCIVVDNPPFSMFKQITSFYLDGGILFFLFGPALTMGNANCPLVITGADITYENGAKVPTEFASNIPGLPVLSTAPALADAIASCPSQMPKTKSLPSFDWPEESISISDLRTIASGGVSFSIDRAVQIWEFDMQGKRLFGGKWLISQAKAKAKAKAKPVIKVELSERERRIVELLA